MTAIGRIFQNGGSQAVRLPKEFRFEADEVCIKRIGSALLLFRMDKAWELMGEAIGQADDDFMAERNEPEQAEEREPL